MWKHRTFGAGSYNNGRRSDINLNVGATYEFSKNRGKLPDATVQVAEVPIEGRKIHDGRGDEL